MLALCWLMLALCWLMLDQVGSSWLMLAQVGPSWPQDASMLAQVGLKMASKCLQKAKFLRFVIQNCSFWNTQNLQNIKKSICFIGPFAICTFLFLVMLFGSLSWLKFTPSCLMLAYVSKFESKLNQVGSKLAQDASSLSQVGLPKKAFLSEEKTSWFQVGPKSVPEGPRCLSQRVYTSTHLTFIIEHANSHNFHQRTGALRMQKWLPRPSKMTQKRPQMTLKRFYQHMHFSLQPSRYAYADLRHEVCGAGVHACVFNIYIYIRRASGPRRGKITV